MTAKNTPSRLENRVQDDFAFYGVEAAFTIIKLPRPLWRGGGLVHLWHTHRYLSRLERLPDLIYSRDLAAAVLATSFPVPLIFEAHGPPAGGLSRFLHRRLFSSPNLRRLVVISEALEELFRQSSLLPPELDVVVAHDAADPFPTPAPSHESLPQSLSAPGVTHVGYVGHLYPGRGIELLVELAEKLPAHCFHLVGGSPKDLERWRARDAPGNLHFHGFVAPCRLPAFYRAFDVVLAPYQNRVMVAGGGTDTSSWMSPLKLFEYMASGKPIISSDLPVLREVLRHRENALLVTPDAVDEWRHALLGLASEPQLAHDLGEAALEELARNYTWDARAARVLAEH